MTVWNDLLTYEEYVPLGTFWSLDWDSPDDTLEATVTARDRMELLRKGTYQTSQVQTDKSLYELAEAVLQDAGLSSDQYIIDTDLPIKSIERISKIDYTTGLEYDLDVSKATIAQDKLSFTYPDIEDGDIIFFVYEYDRESTTGEMAVEYYDSRFVVEDSAVPGKFYKIKFVVTNGVASIVLEEV